MSALELRRDVMDELEFEPSVNAAHIGVTAEGGVVTLSGYVETYLEKLSAISAARRVKGVKAIADEIDIRAPADKKTADDEIAKRALDMLAWDTVVPAGIAVLVRDGWVTLSGNVDWHFQKRAAEDDVKKLSGVSGLSNNIQVAPRIKPENVKAKIEGALKRHAETQAKAVHVTVRNNDNVLLEGKVANWQERRAIEQAAWSAPGVQSVEDRMTIG
ncbi:BON domain-containing protein [Bradyrhizobium sp. 41S5]|uniref:BON domain-containing protein n=1 Tax=Bradyrhizobium sp. 41S5 TaxID=1404443 RepID=UPI00156B2CBF|nr:BON domain-containing protein [Bradyrhizobium sp. 41S5]UFX49221.1 BON domain-containing protein [Bradyrhizobium sp. 41S5]